MINRGMFFIQLLGYSEGANMAVNNAIRLADEGRCEEVNSLHLLLALLGRNKLGNRVLEYLDTTKEELMRLYDDFLADGAFGVANYSILDDISNETLQHFSEVFAKVLADLTNKSYSGHGIVTTDMLLKEILQDNEDVVDSYLDALGVSANELLQIINSELLIPDSLEGYIKDMNVDATILNSTYVNTTKYTDELIEVLGRKKKPNPCLVGEAGVGKTAIANALVQRIVRGDVPEFLQGVHVCSLESSIISAGTKYRGEFEERMKSILEWASENKVILFVDEFHIFVKSGGSSEAESAGNLIKTKLNDGSIRVIGATTYKEYKKHIENDDALVRRMEQVEVYEPTLEEAITMAKLSIKDYENYHKLRVTEEAIELGAKLSNRYMKYRKFPDKLYTVIDQACSCAKINKSTKVTAEWVRLAVSKLTHIDINKITIEEDKELLKIEDRLGKKVIGQSEAVKVVARAVKRGKSGITDTNRPVASLLFVGPTGVGKTELCKVLSEELAVGKASFIKVDMSEYQDKVSANKFIGSAPGYVGYGEGGQLTEKVKHNPNSVILFDEIEKAHPDIQNVFLQILDEGRLTDGEGQTVDFSNCIVIMTSNAGYGAEGMNKGRLGFNARAEEEDVKKKERVAIEALESSFRPEFLNRIDNIVIFNKLSKEKCEEVTKLLLNKLRDRVKESRDINIAFTPALIKEITERGYSEKYGARNLRREIQNVVEDELSDKILAGEIKRGANVELNWSNKLEIKVKRVRVNTKRLSIKKVDMIVEKDRVSSKKDKEQQRKDTEQ